MYVCMYVYMHAKAASQLLVLHSKKVTENTRPAYATLETLQELFPFVLGSDELLTLCPKRELTKV